MVSFDTPLSAALFWIFPHREHLLVYFNLLRSYCLPFFICLFMLGRSVVFMTYAYSQFKIFIAFWDQTEKYYFQKIVSTEY
jgi:hypothetical protein